MARLHSSLGDRTVYTTAGLAKGQGLPATVYEDPAGTILASLAVYDPTAATVPGAAIPGAALVVDAWSNRPAFWDLNDRDVLYVTVAGGPLEAIRPDAQPQVTALATRVAAAETAADAAIHADQKGAANGVATLDGGSRIPTAQLPPITPDQVGAAPAGHLHDDRYPTEQEMTAAIAAASAGGVLGAHPGFTYTIRKTDVATYTALRADGTTAATGTDSASPVTSGLRAVLTAVAADNTSIYFPAGVYTFPEDPAGDEDHWAPNGINGLTVEGDPSRSTILANWRDDTQGGYDTIPDVEPFSFTRCNELTYRYFRVWAGGNQDANNSSDALDFDSCRGVHVDHVIVERSRARGIVMDGGDSGAVSRRSHITNCEVRGIPTPPNVFAGSAAAVVAQTYRYVVTYVDSVFGETPPSDFTQYKASGSSAMRLRIPTGPAYSATKGVTSRKVYRWSTAQPTYRLLTTVADNTTTIYDDQASDVSLSAAAILPATGTPLVPKEGVKLLGSQRHLVAQNEIVGVGSHGVQLVRKGSDATNNTNSDGHRVIGNTIRRAGAGTATAAIAGVYVGGGSYNLVSGNVISNIGVPSAQGYGVYVQGLAGAATEHNLVGPNTIYDDQDGNSPSGAVSTKYGVSINTAGGGTNPDNTVISPSPMRGMITASVNNAGGTNTRQFAETTHNHPPGPGGPAPVVPGWKSGLWYGARSSMAHGSLAGQALTSDQAYAAPMYVPQDVTVTTIGCNITAGVAGAKLRMAVYTIGATGRPDALVPGSETGDLSGATPGDRTATISAALTGGQWYWPAVLSNQAITVNGFTGGQPNILGSLGPGSATKQSGVRAAVGAGWSAMPATFPANPSEAATTLTVEVSF